MSIGSASVFDVAKYIIRKLGPVSAMKLHKLLYYSQAWASVWTDRPLFKARIEAWVSGPVISELFKTHRGKYLIKGSDLQRGDIRSLKNNQKEAIDKVLKYYGDKDSQWLSDLTHMEDPWKKARRGLANNERGGQEITLASMSEYYSSISPESNVQ